MNTILDGYRGGGDPKGRIALLSTYLGHVDPASTYWYLSAAPELMALAGARLERHLGGAAGPHLRQPCRHSSPIA